MAKLKSPLMSFSASGSLADTLTFLNIRGGSYVKSKQGPIGATSPAQLIQRAKFKAACVYSHLLTDEEKLYWHNVDKLSGACPWLINFMSAFLVDPGQFEEAMIKSIQHSSATIPINTTSGSVEISPVDVSNTVLIHLGNKWFHYYYNQYSTYIELTDSTTVVARVYSSNEDYPVEVEFIALEFNPAAVKSRQFCCGVLAAFDLSVIVEIDEVDLSKVILLPAGTRSEPEQYSFRCEVSRELIDSSHVELIRHQGGPGLEVFFIVFEFN